uniref:Dynein light intermediate chain n=1 Tax=Syphacia muris TaxID=451379 RepID=A0A0N5AUL5_9BILA
MPPTGFTGVPLRIAPSINAVTASGDDDNENIWTQILSEVSARSSNHTHPGSVLFLGDRQCGKSCLLGKLEKREVSERGSALEYHFINVHTDYRDASYAYQLSTAGSGVAPGESVTLPVWVLDGYEAFAPLTKFALTSALSRNVIVICASFSNFGSILPSLNKWADLISNQISSIFSSSAIAEGRQAQEIFWQEYVEPLESSMHSDKIPSLETEHELLPLEKGVLTKNCGAAMVVVLTKCDLARSEMSDEQLDRLQFHVRKFCMEHGAALVIYTSAKEEKNTPLLYKYLIHRACGLPFTTPAHVIERDSVFVPAGWDTTKKLDILKESTCNVEIPLEVQPEGQTVEEEQVEAHEEQEFLLKLSSVEVPVPKRTPIQKPVTEVPDGNSPLLTFFNNLLKTKDQNASSRTPFMDAQAQLQRMLEQANVSSSTPQHQPQS